MSAPVQLDLLSMLDYDPRQDSRRALMLRYLDGKPETYSDRHQFGCLTPGEECPGCGHIFRAGGKDASGDHHMTPGRTECEGRTAYLKHAANAWWRFYMSKGAYSRFEDAVAAAAPCWTKTERAAWLNSPERHLYSEVTA